MTNPLLTVVSILSSFKRDQERLTNEGLEILGGQPSVNTTDPFVPRHWHEAMVFFARASILGRVCDLLFSALVREEKEPSHPNPVAPPEPPTKHEDTA